MKHHLTNSTASIRRLLLFPILLPQLSIAFPTSSNKQGKVSTEALRPICSPPATSPTDFPTPAQCEAAVTKFYAAIPRGDSDPIFTIDPAKAQLPNHYQLPRAAYAQGCRVAIFPPWDLLGDMVEIDMAAFVFEANRMIEFCRAECAAKGGLFAGGSISMSGVTPNTRVTIKTYGEKFDNRIQLSALSSRTPNDYFSPTCYTPTEHSAPQRLVPHNCERALHSFWESVPSGIIGPILTRDDSKARHLPNYISNPQKWRDAECLLTVGLRPRVPEATIDLPELTFQADRVIDQCVAKGPFNGGFITMGSINIEFRYQGLGGGGQSLRNGTVNMTEAFVLPLNSSVTSVIDLPFSQPSDVLAATSMM